MSRGVGSECGERRDKDWFTLPVLALWLSVEETVVHMLHEPVPAYVPLVCLTGVCVAVLLPAFRV